MPLSDLKPCPHCGSDRITVFNIRDGQQAVCKDCKSMGSPTYHGPEGFQATRGKAVEAWNRRVEADLIAKMAEALEPFASEADARQNLVLGSDIDHWPIGGSSLNLGHLRRASEALALAKAHTLSAVAGLSRAETAFQQDARR